MTARGALVSGGKRQKPTDGLWVNYSLRLPWNDKYPLGKDSFNETRRFCVWTYLREQEKEMLVSFFTPKA